MNGCTSIVYYVFDSIEQHNIGTALLLVVNGRIRFYGSWLLDIYFAVGCLLCLGAEFNLRVSRLEALVLSPAPDETLDSFFAAVKVLVNGFYYSNGGL